MDTLEKYFEKFRKNIIGEDFYYHTPYGDRKILYNDWIASGRLYGPIEKKMINDFGPYVANTHTETSETGTRMTHAYKRAREIIKKHVNAGPEDILIFGGYGMTGVVNKFQRILGLKDCREQFEKNIGDIDDRPVVLVTHMEHHSNHTSWYETIADVVIVEPGEDLLVDLSQLRRKLEEYKSRKLIIGAFTACSNVTGVLTPVHEMASIIHEYGGLCFVDYAASAPYMEMNMHPENPSQKLDAIYFSPHKFLGGPGSSGVVIFDSSLYKLNVPDQPGGGTVDWTNRWGEYKYVDDIELREDGGTPGFLQAIKAALVVRLKEEMGIDKIKAQEVKLVSMALKELAQIEGIHILAANASDRIGVFSFYHESIHYNLIVKLLSDKFGIQVRGGCVCAGTYGHYLLNVSKEKSDAIVKKIESGDLSDKPGWVRWSVHPVTKLTEVQYFIDSLEAIIQNHVSWSLDYQYDKKTNEYYHKEEKNNRLHEVEKWFKF